MCSNTLNYKIRNDATENCNKNIENSKNLKISMAFITNKHNQLQNTSCKIKNVHILKQQCITTV